MPAVILRPLASVALALLLAACGSSSKPTHTVDQLDQGTYYAGMALFANEISQLGAGTVLGIRLTEGDGAGKVEERIGSLSITAIDAEGVTFDFYTYDLDQKSRRSAGSVTLAPDGVGADLDADGEADVSYVTSPVPRDGLTDERYLKFALHRRPPGAKRVSFRIVENGQTAPLLAARHILQFDHDGALFLNDRQLSIVTDYDGGTIAYANDPALSLVRPGDTMLISRRTATPPAEEVYFPEAATTVAEAAAFTRADLPDGMNHHWWNHVVHTVTHTVQKVATTVTTAATTVVTAAEKEAEAITDEWNSISAFWGKIQDIRYTGTPLTLSHNDAYRSAALSRLAAGTVLSPKLEGGQVILQSLVDLSLSLDIDISLDPSAFAQGALTGHPTFATFSLNSTMTPTLRPTLTLNLPNPLSFVYTIPLSEQIWIEDTPFTITPGALQLKMACTLGGPTLTGDLAFVVPSSLQTGFDQGTFSGTGSSQPALAWQNAFESGTAASCTVGMGPAVILNAAEIIHFPLTMWSQMKFDGSGITPQQQLTTSMTVGVQGITLWNIATLTIWSESYPLIAY